MYELTPGAAAWAEKAKMPSSRGDKAAVTMSDGSIIVVGGETHAREQQSQVAAHPVEQYYPAHNTWVAKASIPTARFRFGAAVVDDIVYAIGGHRVCETDWSTFASDCAERRSTPSRRSSTSPTPTFGCTPTEPAAWHDA